ncbi:MAG: CsgG/HfaB family protein [Gemmatimonadales bacterium]
MLRTTASLALALTTLVAVAARAQEPQQPATPAAAAQAPAQGQNTKPGIAVLDFDLGLTMGQPHDDYEALRRGLASLTITELTANPAIRVVERTQLQQLLQEQNLGREGRLDNETMARVGRIIGARYMVTGTFFDNHGAVRVDARIFNVETSEILRTQSVTGRMDNLYDMLPRLAQQLMHDAQLPPLERGAANEFRQANPPPPTQAVMAYSRAVLYADRGDTNRAVEQYRHALQTFPQYTQARTACNALQAGACT